MIDVQVGKIQNVGKQQCKLPYIVGIHVTVYGSIQLLHLCMDAYWVIITPSLGAKIERRFNRNSSQLDPDWTCLNRTALYRHLVMGWTQAWNQRHESRVLRWTVSFVWSRLVISQFTRPHRCRWIGFGVLLKTFNAFQRWAIGFSRRRIVLFERIRCRHQSRSRQRTLLRLDDGHRHESVDV